MKKVLIAADEVDKWSQLCEGLKNEWECTTVNLDVFEKFHTIAVYDAVLMLVRNDNGKLGRLIWEVRQYSRAPIIVVIPGIQAVFFVKHFSLKKASEFPVFSEGFSLL